MDKGIKQLYIVIETEYNIIRRRFVKDKYKLKNGLNIEDVYHNCLLNVIENAMLDKFQFIDYNKTKSYINRTMFKKIITHHTEKQNTCIENVDENNYSENELFNYISNNYNQEQLQNSIFNKLLAAK